MDTNKIIKVLEDIAADAKKDATDFDGKPFNGKVVGTYLGYHGASIAALADIIKELINEFNKPQSKGKSHQKKQKLKERSTGILLFQNTIQK